MFRLICTTNQMIFSLHLSSNHSCIELIQYMKCEGLLSEQYCPLVTWSNHLKFLLDDERIHGGNFFLVPLLKIFYLRGVQ